MIGVARINGDGDSRAFIGVCEQVAVDRDIIDVEDRLEIADFVASWVWDNLRWLSIDDCNVLSVAVGVTAAIHQVPFIVHGVVSFAAAIGSVRVLANIDGSTIVVEGGQIHLSWWVSAFNNSVWWDSSCSWWSSIVNVDGLNV